MMTAQAKDRRYVDTGARNRGRVLLVTDEQAKAYEDSLEAIGVEVVGVSGGPAAMVSLQRSRPHVVIASSSVKGISIREMAKMLGQGPDRVPLILTGSEESTQEQRSAALAMGAFDYFHIPVEFPLLASRTRQLVEMSILMQQLRADADLDYLTGLANRRRFRSALGREVERWRRYSVPCGLLLLDIDHLKAINDKYGHSAGDMVIRRVGSLLTEVSRDNDTAARLGGEEFALLLAGIDARQIATAAERLRGLIAADPVEGVGHFSVSIGVAACPTHAESERSLYAACDKALYVAKNSGRNQISVATLKVGQSTA
jgi:diguanylate cyclase (GGDEF)-like protein